jgi:alkanesulfonate monooxygenase SsuD/methylene tetrahydromethanopterin reductase-like flavin-dependent oxidoreductase (luciferase family)
VRFGIFYEHQLPRPWGEDGERRLLTDALEQVEVADRVGFDYVWEVEHHFLEEYSHSSAPEVFLAAASQRTKRIRLGHGIIQVPPGVNHPARVAERVATLDLVSGGRVDLGTGESSSAAELGGFLVDREQKRAQWEDMMEAIPRMFVEEPFAGWDSEWVRMPPRNVVPKPQQKPHPPLWVACSRRETIHLAARKGIGALSFSFAEPEDARRWVDDYYRILGSAECVPAGFAVNANLTVVLPMMCHKDEQTAIERGVDGAHFFGYSLAHYFGMTPHRPGVTNVHDEFLERRHDTGFARDLIRPDREPLGVKILEQGLGSLRGAIGTPAQLEELVERYEEAGVDQIVFVLQAGNNRHEHICESIELFGKKVLPRFAERAEQREREKAGRLAPAIDAALHRREPARRLDREYVIDEQAELASAGRGARAGATGSGAHARDRGGIRHRAARRRLSAEKAARRGGEALLARLVRGASDEDVERRFGNRIAQRMIFTGMAQAFEPDKAQGFEGDIVYELTHGGDGGRPDVWTVRIKGRRATVRRVESPNPAIRLRMAIPDFMRVVTREVDPALPLLQGRIAVEGDLRLAPRLGEMFGQPSPY